LRGCDWPTRDGADYVSPHRQRTSQQVHFNIDNNIRPCSALSRTVFKIGLSIRQMSSPEESPAQRTARQRRERREAKIKAGGSARLDKITSLSGRTPASSMSLHIIFLCDAVLWMEC
jgi:hypothetical protein